MKSRLKKTVIIFSILFLCVICLILLFCFDSNKRDKAAISEDINQTESEQIDLVPEQLIQNGIEQNDSVQEYSMQNNSFENNSIETYSEQNSSNQIISAEKNASSQSDAEHSDISKNEIISNSSNDMESIYIFENKKYKLTFNDDFEGEDINTSYWTRCKEQKRQNLNGYWKNNCSYTKAGNLVIECKQNEDGTFSSGAISSKNKFVQNHGLYEIKFMITKSSALWYAFWLNTDGMFVHHEKKNSVEEGLEFDIFEILPGKDAFCTGLHYGGYEYWDNKLVTKSRQINIDDSFYNTYHIVDFVWNEEGYFIYLDNKPLYNIKSSEAGGVCYEDAYVLVSAEYGTWGGSTENVISPSYLYVDYIKIFTEDLQ